MHNPAARSGGFDHFHAVACGMRHGFLAVDVLSSVNAIYDNSFVPMIRHRRDEAVDFFIVEEVLVAPRRRHGTGDFPGQAMPAIIKITDCNTFDSRQLNGIFEQIGALHADSDDAKSYAVAGRDLPIAGCFEAWVSEKESVCGRESRGCTCAVCGLARPPSGLVVFPGVPGTRCGAISPALATCTAVTREGLRGLPADLAPSGCYIAQPRHAVVFLYEWSADCLAHVLYYEQ